ncbi:MAG TPA: DUF58 domain-containing protein [Lapillicoccus sp.]|nr:DUF58 domain-containing protein [Lapillicoccus sp.]
MARLRDVLTGRGRAFVASGATLAAAGWGLGFPDISRVGVLLLVLPLVTGLIARRQRAVLRVERHTSPPRVSVDERAIVTVVMSNVGTRRTPLLLAEERLNLALGDRPRFLLGQLAPGEVRQVEYAVRSHLRGRHPLGPLSVVLRDPFGLTNRFAEVGATGNIVVLPRIFPLTGGRPPGNGVGAEGEIPFMVALHGEDDQSIREYRDGDDLRRIHWPATARTGDLMVRQEDRPARRRAMILLDPRASAHQGHGASSSFEWAVSAAASIVTHLAGLGYATHLVCSETVHDGQAAMTTDADHALDVLAEVETGPDVELTELVRAAHPVTASGGLVVAILADQDEEALRQVASLRQPGGSGLAVVLDTPTFAEGARGGSHIVRSARDSGSAAGSPRAPSLAATAYAEVLHTAGWSVTVAGQGDPVPAVWSALTTRGVLVG